MYTTYLLKIATALTPHPEFAPNARYHRSPTSVRPLKTAVRVTTRSHPHEFVAHSQDGDRRPPSTPDKEKVREDKKVPIHCSQGLGTGVYIPCLYKAYHHITFSSFPQGQVRYVLWRLVWERIIPNHSPSRLGAPRALYLRFDHVATSRERIASE